MSNIYDYIMDKVDVSKLLDYYGFNYDIKGDVIWMCCPFHSETEPSFTFNMITKLYGCWGCKLKGNPITFVKEYELLENGKDLTYYDAALELCRICSIKINLSYKEKLDMELDDVDDISDVLDMELDNSSKTQQDTFMESAIKKFYVKKNSYMIDKGYNKEILDYLEMGFFTGDTKNPMNNRCIFPVRNERGQLVGWTGRSILSNAKIKWVHAPSKRFMKSLNLYNIDKALKHILEVGEVNVVESVGNLIRMLETGRYNTVATLGSTISVEQCEMLLSYNVDIIFWYDWDKGGFEGINLVLEYISNYDILKIAVTDYGVNDDGKALDIGDVDIATVNGTRIISVYEYIEYMKERFVANMKDSFDKDVKVKLTDGTIVLCTNKLNPNIEMPQLTPEDINFFKLIDSYFGVKELKLN